MPSSAFDTRGQQRFRSQSEHPHARRNLNEVTYTSALACAGLWFVPAYGAAYAADELLVDPCTLVTKAEVEEIIGRVKGIPTSNREERVQIYNFEFVSDKDALELWVFQPAVSNAPVSRSQHSRPSLASARERS